MTKVVRLGRETSRGDMAKRGNLLVPMNHWEAIVDCVLPMMGQQVLVQAKVINDLLPHFARDMWLTQPGSYPRHFAPLLAQAIEDGLLKGIPEKVLNDVLALFNGGRDVCIEIEEAEHGGLGHLQVVR